MKYKNKNSTIARQQNSGINNIHILKILACLQENCKYIFFTVLISIISIHIAEILGKFIAYLIWR